MRTYSTTAIAVAIGGVGFLTWLIYVQPQAQGGIAVMFTPLYQMVGIALLWFGRRPS